MFILYKIFYFLCLHWWNLAAKSWNIYCKHIYICWTFTWTLRDREVLWINTFLNWCNTLIKSLRLRRNLVFCIYGCYCCHKWVSLLSRLFWTCSIWVSVYSLCHDSMGGSRRVCLHHSWESGHRLPDAHTHCSWIQVRSPLSVTTLTH